MHSAWLVPAVLAGLASNAFNFFNRVSLKDGDDIPVFSWFFEFARAIVFLMIIFFDFRLVPSTKLIGTLAVLGLVETISINYFVKMHAYTHLSISTIIQRTRMAWVPILAFLFLRERLELHEYLGIAILFIGTSLAASPRRIFVDKGIKTAYISSFFTALIAIIMKEVSAQASTSVVMLAWSIPTILIFPFLIKDFRKRVALFLQKRLSLKVLAAASNIVAMYLFLFALKVGPVSKVTAIYQGMMIVSIFLGIVTLKEREDVFKKISGAAIAIMGMLILF